VESDYLLLLHGLVRVTLRCYLYRGVLGTTLSVACVRKKPLVWIGQSIAIKAGPDVEVAGDGKLSDHSPGSSSTKGVGIDRARGDH
jgi:hypothetical protein